MPTKRTLYDKIIDIHRVITLEGPQGAGEQLLLYVDRTVLNEYTSPQAFSGLREANRALWRPRAALGVVDHVNSTAPQRGASTSDRNAQRQMDYFASNARDFGFEMYDILHPRQGIEHVVLPDIGWVLPGLVIAAGDSHTTTYGAFGAVGFGIGTSDIEHLLATQCLVYRRQKTMRITLTGRLPLGVTPKDLVMAVIRRIGAAGAAGYALELAGPAIRSMDVEGRMTICNMAVECGARVALIAPDEQVYDYMAGRPRSLSTAMLKQARQVWKELVSDPGAIFDREIEIPAQDVSPMVSWGTSPDQAAPVDCCIPNIDEVDQDQKAETLRALEYMDLEAGSQIKGIAIDRAFIGSCTNGRLSDLRDAARILAGRKVAAHVRAMVSPGSSMVRRAAEAEGLDRVFIEAGFEWRQSGCSMCLAMNDDVLAPGERCASSTNRNFEGRQGSGGRTHLMSPAMVAAAAIAGHIADVRDFAPREFA
jgi:3-isopropylmalate/(R)-2-methylmalate dehydratase large subunit